MAHVTVTINAKTYNLACDDGEEARHAQGVTGIGINDVGR